ncbi:MAG: hypothetical protein ACK41P_00535 [Asticcacaulis sp.]
MTIYQNKFDHYVKSFKPLLVLLLGALVLGACDGLVPDRSVKNPFPNATEVRLFVNTDYNQNGEPIFSHPQGRRLTQAQRYKLEKSLFLTPLPEYMAACFIPHHFFRYYNAQGQEIGEIAVCFCCDGVRVSGNTNLKVDTELIVSAKYEDLKTLVTALDEPTDVFCD